MRRIENYENIVLSRIYDVPYTTTVIVYPDWTENRVWARSKKYKIPFPGDTFVKKMEWSPPRPFN
jgi:hypothetical protein